MALSDSPETIKRKVIEYFRRIESDKHILLYDLEEEGLWKFVPGDYEIFPEDKRDLVNGRYVDAIAWMVEQSRFYGDWVSSDNAGNPNNGYLVRAEHLAVSPNIEGASLEGVVLKIKLEREENRMKTIAWNVDTQYDFMSPVGKLPIKDAPEIEPNLERLTNYFRGNGITIVNTGDWHTPESEELSDKPDYVTQFPPHCIIGTPGADYVPAVKTIIPEVVDWRDEKLDLEKLLKSREIVLYKDKFDVFLGNPHTDEVLDTLAPERVVVYGVATDYCVNYAVTGLLERGLEVYVVEDAIKEIASAAPVIEKWKELGAKLIRTDDLYK